MGLTGNRKISPDAYCGPEVSWSGIIIAGWEVWCAWQLLLPSVCIGWMGEPERQIHPGHCLQPPMDLSRTVALWITYLSSQWDSLFWFFVPLHKRSSFIDEGFLTRTWHHQESQDKTCFFFLVCLFCLIQTIIWSFLVFCSKTWTKDSELLPGWAVVDYAPLQSLCIFRCHHKTICL